VTFTKVTLALACLVSGGVGMACLMSGAQIAQVAQGAPEAKVTQLMSKDLTDLPAKKV